MKTFHSQTLLWISHSGRTDGGAELSLCSLLGSAKKRGYKQHVVIPSAEGLEKELKKLGVDYSIIPFTWWTIGGVKRWQDLKNNFLMVGRLYDLMCQLNCSVVITNTMVHPWAALASTKAGVPHAWMVREFGGSGQELKFIFGHRATYWFIDRFSSLIVSNSQAVKNHLLNFIKNDDKIIVSYPSVAIPNLSLYVGKSSKAHVEIIMVGNVRESKGQLEVVKALCLLPPSILSTISLTLVGSYQDFERQKIEKYLQENGEGKDLVKFLGFQSDPFRFLSKADIYIMASKNEGFGRVTVAAMAVGLPVIGTRSGGTPEIVVDKETGVLYEPGNLESLSSAILELIQNAELRLQMGNKGKTRVKEVFNEAAVTEPLFSQLDKIPTEPKQAKVKYVAAFLSIIIMSAAAFWARFPYRFIKSLGGSFGA